MAEPWAYASSLDVIDPESNEPDRPIPGHLTKHSRKSARAGLAMVLYVRSKVCLRDLSRKYLGDKSREDADGGIYAGDVDEANRVQLNPPKGKKRKAKGLADRRVIERGDLQCRLRTWLALAHASDPLRAVRSAKFILGTKAIKALSAVAPDCIMSVSQVVMAIQETEEWGIDWGADVLAIISAYDTELNQDSDEHADSSKGKKGSKVGVRKEKSGEED
ncbi:hypothetical protein K438DRAFT_1767523 [Mycena galopus ATCC 62051]|nr:hypothetical protein K438DRAFT_1767523 [Mycena galopus ATCC 62051]